MKAAVADAGPLIHLSEIGCLSFLTLFESIHIPDGVWLETAERGRVREADISEFGNVRRHTLPQAHVAQFVQDNSLGELQAGEIECLYLCQQMGVSTLLTDDLAVRETAKRLDLTPVGSLGIVVRACRVGRISLNDAERYIFDLYDVSSLFVTRAIVELSIELLHSRSDQL